MVLFGSISNTMVNPPLALVKNTTVNNIASNGVASNNSVAASNNNVISASFGSTALQAAGQTSPLTGNNFISQFANALASALASKFSGGANTAGINTATSVGIAPADATGMITQLLGEIIDRLTGGRSTSGENITALAVPHKPMRVPVLSPAQLGLYRLRPQPVR